MLRSSTRLVANRTGFPVSAEGSAMRLRLFLLSLVLAPLTLSAQGWSGFAAHKFPAAALSSKTVAILNDTHTKGVTDGAVEEFKDWGHLRVVDDPENADIVIDFTKEREHSTTHTQKTDSTGTPTDYGFGVSFSSKVKMTATTRNGATAFYTTTTDEGKKKAGRACVQAFIGAFQNSVQPRSR